MPSHLVRDYLLLHRGRARRDLAAGGANGDTDGAARSQPLGVELHERWHHGLAILLPFAMRKVLAPFYQLVDDVELQANDPTGCTPTTIAAASDGSGHVQARKDVAKMGTQDPPYPVSYKVAMTEMRGARVSREAS